MVDTDVHIIHLRQAPLPQSPVEKIKGGKRVLIKRTPVYPHGAITIASRLNLLDGGEAAYAALIGVAFCSTRDTFARQKGAAIARQRLENNPLSINVERTEVTHQLVRQVLRTMLLDPPQWAEEEEHLVLNPDRFNTRLHAELIGPDGLLVHLEVDARDSEKKRPRNYARMGDVPFRERMSTWVLKLPMWARAFMVEVQT
jgi:hypothetical protein